MITSRATGQGVFSLFEKFGSSTVGIFLYCCCQGMGGIIILLFFISLIYSQTILPLGLPLIAGFNSAAAGFALVERRKQTLHELKFQLITIGTIIGISGPLFLVLFCPWESLTDPINHIQSIGLSVPLTFLGAWIGVQSSRNNPPATTIKKEDTP